MVTSAVWNFVALGSVSSRTGCLYIEIFRETAMYNFEEDLFFRFSEWRIPRIM